MPRTIAVAAPARRGALEGQHAAHLVDHGPVTVLVVGYDGHVHYASPAAVDLLGLDGQRLLLAYSTDYLQLAPLIRDWLTPLRIEGRPRPGPADITRVERADGTARWVHLEFAALPQTDGAEPLLAVHLTDRTAVHQLLRTTRAKAAGLDLMASRTSIALIITDATGAVVQTNPAAELLFPARQDQPGTSPTIRSVTGFTSPAVVGLQARALRGEVVRDEPLDDEHRTLLVSVAAFDATIAEQGAGPATMSPSGARLVWMFAEQGDGPEERARLRANESRLRKILQHINDTVTVIDEEGNTLAASGQFATVPVLGFSAQQWRDGLNLFELVHPEDRPDIGGDLEALLAAPGTAVWRELRIRSADGAYLHAEGWAVNLLDDPDVAGILVTTRDISARKRHEALIADQTAVLGLVAAGSAPEPIMSAVVDLVERQLPGTAAALLLPAAESDRPLTRVVTGDHLPESIVAPLVTALCPGGPTFVDTLTSPDTDWFASTPELAEGLEAIGRTAVTVQPIVAREESWGALVVTHPAAARTFGDHELNVLRTAADLVAIASERERSRRQLAYQALHDEVTGLANRHLLLDRLAQAVNRAKRRGRRMALMFLDVDRFKEVNDWLGHEAGDDLLRQFADRLRSAVRPEDTVARFGGDEFVVLVEHVVDEHDVALIADRLQRSLDGPFDVAGHRLPVTASIGVAVAERGAIAPHVLLRHADTAMYRAKELGRNRLEMFDDELEAQLAGRIRLEDDLRLALELDQLTVEYQPLIELRTGAICGVEALLRWNHPVRGRLLPGEFLDLAEESGLMVALGSWVLERALDDLARSDERTGRRDLALHVNLSPRQLAHPDLPHRLEAALARHGISAERLVVEVAERALAAAHPTAESNLAKLRALGVAVAVDDAGAGPSAIPLLDRLVVDQLKVDGSVIARVGVEHTGGGALAAALAGLAAGLGIPAVAEEVQSIELVDRLIELGFRFGQGHALGDAVDVNGLDGLRRPGGGAPPAAPVPGS